MTKPPTKPKPPEPTLEYQRQELGRMDGWRNKPKDKDEKRK